MIKFKPLFFWLIALLLLIAGQPARALEGYPSKPIMLVVPFEPGSTTDILGRQIATIMTENMGQPIVIENRPGSGGMNGARAVARAKPDGYTILYISNGITAEQSLRSDSGFDVLRDLTPITDTISTPLSILVHKDVPVKSLPEFLAYAKKNPGKLNYSSSGIGGSSHLATAAFLAAAGIDVQHIPYKGGAPALQAVLANEVQLLLMSPGASNEQVDAGNLRRLALTSKERSPLLPNVPTAIESGISDYEYYSWFGFFAPAGTPEAIVKKLQQEIAAALRQPKIADNLKAGNYEIGGTSPETFRARVASEVKVMAEVIKQLGIKMQ